MSPIIVTNRATFGAGSTAATAEATASSGLAHDAAARLLVPAGYSTGTGTANDATISNGSPTFPGQSTTGYLNHPSWPGSFIGGVDTAGTGHSVTGETVNFVDFRGGWAVGTSSVSASNVTFNGCRFQFSANVSNQGDATAVLCLLFGSNVTFNYCTFQPWTSNYPTELTGEEVSGNTSTYVEYGKSYQYAMVGDGGYNSHIGRLTISNCDFWGFGNALQLAGSTVANPHVVQDSWFHHGGDPFVVNSSANQYHNDVWLVNDGNYYGAQFLRNRAEIWGNTNVIAWQGAGAYDDCQVVGNLIGGDQETVSLSASGTSARVTFTDNWFATRIGRSVGTGKPLRSWAVSDSGSGSTWRRNKWWIDSGEASSNYPGAKWGTPSKHGQYWWPSDTDSSYGHATDYTG